MIHRYLACWRRNYATTRSRLDRPADPRGAPARRPALHGGPCLLEVVVPDLKRYEQFLMGTLLKLPMVKDIRSNFAMRTVKADAPLLLFTRRRAA